jgi:hypothetical protein
VLHALIGLRIDFSQTEGKQTLARHELKWEVADVLKQCNKSSVRKE